MITHLPTAGLPDRILGMQLRHLRECQREQPSTVAARLTMSPDTLAAVENGHSRRLRSAVLAGDGLLWARAYGAGQLAAEDWSESVDQHGRYTAVGLAPEAFYDDGPAWAHRHQIVEREAARVLIAAGGQVLPVPLQTEELEEAVWRVTPGGGQRQRRQPALGALPGTGCGLCQVYRADMLTDRAAAVAWQRDVHRARRAAFEERIGRPGAPYTTVLLDEAVLHRRTGGKELHARQMGHLARLVETTALRVRIVPFDAGGPVPTERVQLETGGEVLTVCLSSGYGVVYEAAADSRMADLEEQSLGPQASLDLLQQAARGTLPRP